MAVFSKDGVTGSNQRIRLTLQFHVNSGGKIRQKFGISAVDGEQRYQITDFSRKGTGLCDRGKALQFPRKGKLRISIQPDMDALSFAQPGNISLVHAGAYLHAAGIYYLHKWKTGADLIAFLDFREVAAFPHGVDDCNAVHRR